MDLKPSPRDISAIIGKFEKLKSIRQNLAKTPLDFPKVEREEIRRIEWSVYTACKEADGELEITIPQLFAPNEIKQNLSKLSVAGLESLISLLNEQIPKIKSKSKIRELQDVHNCAKLKLEEKVREAEMRRWGEQTNTLIEGIGFDLMPWRAYFLSLGFVELANLDFTHSDLSIVLCDSCSKFPLSKEHSPDLLLNQIVGQLRAIKLIRQREIEAEAKQKKSVDENTPPLATLNNPVTCVEVSKFVRVRSDNVAAALQKHRYQIVKSGGKNYCDADDAAILWPKWKKHWQKQQTE